MSERKRKDAKLSKALKCRAGESAPVEFQDVNQLAEGEVGQTVNDIIADQIIKAAMKGERWAIEMYRDGTEGKPGLAVKEEGGDRTTDERLDDLTTQQLNQLAGRALGAQPVNDREADRGSDRDADVADNAAPPTWGFLDVPDDGDSDSEDA